VSGPDKLDPSKIRNVPLVRVQPEDDGWLQLNLRLDLDEIAAAEEEQLRHSPRRQPVRSQLQRLACKIYDERRQRERVFNNSLFGEPAWDMLLALYGLPSRGIFLSVTSLSHAANVAPSTGHRWQGVLFEEGLIQRGPPSPDTRQRMIGLTDKGRSLMEKYLTRLYFCVTPLGADTE
jgi:DNA-binding MarR family transcriptional regulator